MSTRLLQRALRCVGGAHVIDDPARLLVGQPTAVLQSNRRKHQRKRRESLRNVVADRFADLTFCGGVVQYIVRDLERQAKQPSVLLESFQLLPLDLAKEATQLA